MPIRKRKYQTRVNLVDVVTFDGKNSKDVAEFIRSLGFEARARGVYVEFNGHNISGGKSEKSATKIKILKGQKIVVDQVKYAGSEEFVPSITIMWAEDFNRVFEPKKPAISEKRSKATLEFDKKAASEHVNVG